MAWAACSPSSRAHLILDRLILGQRAAPLRCRDGSPLHTDGLQLLNMTKLVRSLGAAAGEFVPRWVFMTWLS